MTINWQNDHLANKRRVQRHNADYRNRGAQGDPDPAQADHADHQGDAETVPGQPQRGGIERTRRGS